MRKFNLRQVVRRMSVIAALGLTTSAFGQVDVVATAGTPLASYTTLKAAFDAINAGTHQGTIGIGISANTTETAPAVLNSTGAGSASYLSVLIQPTVDGVSISGASATGRGIIELKGADNVTINGDNPNTGGTNRNLSIINTAAAATTLTSVIRIATAATVVTSADNITITNCILTGSATGRNASGFTSTSAAENNTFAIYAGGNGGSTATDAPTALTSVTTNTAVSGTTINALTISNNAINAAARAIVFNGAAASVSPGTLTISNNLIGDQVTSLVGNGPFATPATTVYTKGLFIAGTTSLSVTGNTLKNIMSYVATATNAIELNSAIGAAGSTIDVSNNSIIGVVNNSSSGAAANGIIFSAAAQPFTINNNTVSFIQTVSSASAVGISLSTSASSGMISLNKISKVYAISTGGYAARGIFANGGNNLTIQNNTIWDLNAVNNNSTTSTAFAVKGISLASGTGHKVYHNTVNLFGAMLGASTTADNTTCLMISTSSQTGIDIRNNIFSNTMTGDPATVHGCIQLPSGASASMGLTLNNNAYYKGGAANSYYAILQGTFTGYNNLLTMRAYTSTLSAAGTNDNASIASTSAAPFVSSSDLHINTGVTPTQLESGGAVVGVTTDIDGQNRPGPAGSVNGGGTAPDMGADEFDGAPLSAPTVTLNSVTPPTTAQCTATARLVSVNVANTSGSVVSVSLGYTVNGVAQAPISMTNVSGTTWEATIPVPTPANATIAWGVSATNSFALNGTYTGTTYADEPLFGATASASASSATVCSGSPSSLSATVVKTGAATVGSGITTTGATEELTAFCNRRITYKQQTVYTAADLTAAGLFAGPITAIGYTITSVGDASNTSNFTVKIGTTALSTLTDYVPSGSFTVCRPAATYNHAVGLNTITFSTPFNWDGTSNIIVEVTHGGIDNINNAQTVYTTTAGNTVAYGYNGAATGTLSNKRFNTTFTGNTAVAITSVTWMDGPTTVGTGNPLVVNPTTTTTYTANIIASGCPVSPSPTTTVTVNPLPSAPTASNSAQCGTQIPAASVTSTSGLPTPTFIWYNAAVAGTALQTSTSTTYTSNVATTTTFYVSELNTTTGCESARTPVTVTVAAADGISASASATTICIGNSITLTAANTNPTPNQSYTYTWSGVANSGANPSVNGASVTVTPTQPGTYQYDLSGVDGGCNAVANVTVTVDPFTATVAPINVTCNGYNNGSFSVTGSSCGTMPYEYSVDGGGYITTIPTNLTPGAHTVVVKDANGYLSSTLNITITEPSTTIAAPSGTNATVCQNSLSAQVSATSLTNTPTPQTTVVNFALATQPTETQAAPGVAISTATLPTLPAGAVITGVTLACNGIVPHGGEYQSDVRLGLSGAFTDAAASGTGTIGFGTVAETPYNYTRAIPTAGFPTTGGTLNVVYWNNFNDVVGDDATFPIGASAITLTINYTIPTPATISWWDASSNGTQIGAGSPFETVGTSVLPNTNTPGTYTVYAQGEYGGCSSVSRTPVTVTVKATSASTTTITACGSYTWTNGTNYTTSGTYTQTLTNSVGCDSIATLNLTINMPTSSSTSASACGSYTWAQNSTTYTTSGAYSVTLPGANSVGCDSTITLNLTINQPTSSTISASACGSYTWAQNSTTYTTSGAYSVTLPGANANGCDSTITLNLTINQPTSSTISASACGSYTWADNSTTYTTSGTYTATLVGANANGCDSTITLNLTINQPTSSTISVSACGSYTWADNSTTYTTSGTYTATLVGANANGCDSTITLNLTINQPTTATVTASACESYTWGQNGMTYTASGMYNDTIVNAAGCDSIITLDLTINMPTTFTVTASACESYTWGQNGMTYTASGMYNDTIVNAAGCDSIITLDLTINMPTTDSVMASACESYTWAQNGMTYTVSGMYNDTIVNAAGCDSIVVLDLTITGLPTATATDNGDATITASAGSGYQWIDCTTGQAIAGATSQTYTATANGDYAVVVTNAGGCSDTSSCVTIDYIGLKEITDASIRVFPNPTNNDVFVTMGATEATVEVSDAQGKLLQTVVVKNGEKVSLGTYETGVYFLRIRTANGSTLERIVKQ